MGGRLRVLICDPADLVRQGMRRVLAGQRDIAIVGEAHSCRQAGDLALQLQPDVVLMGVHQIQGEALETAARISQRAPSCRVAFLADAASVPDLLEAAACGARGLLLKEPGGPRLAEAARTMVGGGWALEPQLVRDLLEYATTGSEAGPEPLGGRFPPHVEQALSPREREVLQALVGGRRNKEIATALGISVGTVKTHLRHIFRKLSVADRTSAVLEALQARVGRAA